MTYCSEVQPVIGKVCSESSMRHQDTTPFYLYMWIPFGKTPLYNDGDWSIWFTIPDIIMLRKNRLVST